VLQRLDYENGKAEEIVGVCIPWKLIPYIILEDGQGKWIVRPVDHEASRSWGLQDAIIASDPVWWFG
jgi:hypothetical protein